MPNMLTDPTRRSALMSSIRSKNTKPELLVFKELRARKVYFQRHYDRAPGKPDIALPRKKRAVFIDGDFWHGRTLDHVVEKYGEASSWTVKLRRNIARDAEQAAELERRGWSVLRVWESDIMRVRTRAAVIDEIEAFLRG